MSLTDFKSEEKREILEVFETIPYMDKWIASLVENSIYTLVEEYYSPFHGGGLSVQNTDLEMVSIKTGFKMENFDVKGHISKIN